MSITHKEYKVIFGDITTKGRYNSSESRAIVNKMYDVMVLPERLIDIMIAQVPDDWDYVIIGRFKGEVIYK